MPFHTVVSSTSANLIHHSVSATPIDILSNAREFIKDKLYFTCLSQQPPQYPNVHFFTIDNVLVYMPFYCDFGPNNMAHMIRFCEIMQEKFRNPNINRKKICLYSSYDSDKRANAAFLMCAYMLIVQKKSPEECFQPLVGISPPFVPYRDAGYGSATYHITILDCLKGLHRALHIGLVNLENIDPNEYEFYERVENGDLNWITDKFIALASPKEDPPDAVQYSLAQQHLQQQQQQKNSFGVISGTFQAVSGLIQMGASFLSSPSPATSSATTASINNTMASPAPVSGSSNQQAKKPFQPAYRMQDLIQHLKGKGVTTIIRLNNKIYDRKYFVEAGIEHIELYFPDGTTPPDGILKRFLEICESRTGVIAVHCKAGLGRTGTLIACYLMKHYKLTASEVIGLLRVLRPGSVVGPQQNYLLNMQNRLWKLHPSIKLQPPISMLSQATFPVSQRFPASDVYVPSDEVQQQMFSKQQQAAAVQDIQSRFSTNRQAGGKSKYMEEGSGDVEMYDDAVEDDVQSQSFPESRGASRQGTRVVTTYAESQQDYYESMAAATAALNVSAGDYEGAGVGARAVTTDGAIIPIQPRKQNVSGKPQTAALETSMRRVVVTNTSNGNYLQTSTTSTRSFFSSGSTSTSSTTNYVATATSYQQSSAAAAARYNLRSGTSNTNQSANNHLGSTVPRGLVETPGMMSSDIERNGMAAGMNGFVLMGTSKNLTDPQQTGQLGSNRKVVESSGGRRQ